MSHKHFLAILGLTLFSFIAIADGDDEYRPIEYQPAKIYSQQNLFSTAQDPSNKHITDIKEDTNKLTVPIAESRVAAVWIYIVFAIGLGVVVYFHRLQAKRMQEVSATNHNTGGDRYIKHQLSSIRMTGVEKYIQQLGNENSMTGVSRYLSRQALKNK